MLREYGQVVAGISLILSVMCSTHAEAYQTAQVGPSGATLFAQPKSSAPKKAKLPAGAAVNVMEPSEGGFYRATTAKGETGWILESALIVPKKPKVAAQPPTPPAPAQATPVATPAKGGSASNGIYVGALGGVGVAGGGSSFAFGLDLGYRISPLWSAGAYFTYLNLQSATTTTSTSAAGTVTAVGASLLLLAAEANYHVPQVPEIHFGCKVGMGVSSAAATASTAASSTIAPAAGITAGYDYPVTPLLSLGVEANFFYVMGDIASTVFNGLGAVKFTF